VDQIRATNGIRFVTGAFGKVECAPKNFLDVAPVWRYEKDSLGHGLLRGLG